MASGKRLVDRLKPVVAFHAAVPTSAAPKWVSLKDYAHVTVYLLFENATTVTGAAITLLQATAVAGTGSKALGFTEMYSRIDDSATAVDVKVAVVSNTFTLDNTNSKSGLYTIEVDADSLDTDNAFDCFRVAIANATAQTVAALYMLGGYRFGGKVSEFSNPLVD